MFDKLQQLKELKKMRDEALRMQKMLAAETVEVEENGIRIVMSGDQKIKKIVVEGEENSRLVDILNKAIKRSQEVAAKKIQEMGGGLPNLFGR